MDGPLPKAKVTWVKPRLLSLCQDRVTINIMVTICRESFVYYACMSIAYMSVIIAQYTMVSETWFSGAVQST